jgi:Peptidase family M49
MENASKYTSDENQNNMIVAYVDHFRFGEIDKHKDS